MFEPFHYMLGQLSGSFPEGEARAMARLVLETRFGLTLTDICLGRSRNFSLEERQCLENIVKRLLQKEPVQYVLGQADFCGRTFHVAPGVLIPRPETEELVGWVLQDLPSPSASPRVLDIGTGSGCIAITLAMELPKAQVEAVDISPEALAIAQGNADRLGAKVGFSCRDILSALPDGEALPRWDIIVSNPPYICEREKKEMEKNVLCYEPSLALFVPDNDPLRFYRPIGEYAVRTLSEGGRLYVEINRAYAEETASLFRSLGLRDIAIREDLYGNKRMIQCGI